MAWNKYLKDNVTSTNDLKLVFRMCRMCKVLTEDAGGICCNFRLFVCALIKCVSGLELLKTVFTIAFPYVSELQSLTGHL